MASTSEVTLKINADTAQVEEHLERCVALAERFNELWPDLPKPDGIAVRSLSPEDFVFLRYDGDLALDELAHIKAQCDAVLPCESLILTGGLRLEDVT